MLKLTCALKKKKNTDIWVKPELWAKEPDMGMSTFCFTALQIYFNSRSGTAFKQHQKKGPFKKKKILLSESECYIKVSLHKRSSVNLEWWIRGNFKICIRSTTLFTLTLNIYVACNQARFTTFNLSVAYRRRTLWSFSPRKTRYRRLAWTQHLR